MESEITIISMVFYSIKVTNSISYWNNYYINNNINIIIGINVFKYFFFEYLNTIWKCI